ncbi:MAG: class I SAM-dependent methyltransferase [Candidatus Bathyarchaeota archaeon]
MNIRKDMRQLSFIPNVGKGLRALDVGSGFGHLAVLVKKAFEYEVYAIDHHDFWEERFRKHGIQFTLCELTMESFPFEESYFDCVLFCEVLEHLFVLPHKVLFEVHRVLKPGGSLIVTTPNLLSLDKRIRVLFGRSPFEPVSVRRNEGRDQGHIREYTMKELRLLLQESGFEVVHARYFQEPGVIRTRGRIDLNPLHIIYRVIAKSHGYFDGSIIMVARR